MSALHKTKTVSNKDSEMISNLRAQIKSRIEAAGTNIRALERKSGLNIGTINNILIGTSSNPTAETLRAIADTFNCSIDELLGRSIQTSNKIQQEKFSDFKGYQWSPELFISIITELNEQISAKNLPITSDKALIIATEVYNYSLRKEKSTADETLIEWLLDKSV